MHVIFFFSFFSTVGVVGDDPKYFYRQISSDVANMIVYWLYMKIIDHRNIYP